MKWYSYIILIFLSVFFSYSLDAFKPGFDSVVIGCFLILKYEKPSRVLLAVFLFTLIVDFACMGSLFKGASTLALLPIMYLGILLKDHILPSFSDFFLVSFFFCGYIVYFFLIRWLYALFGVNISSVPAIFLAYRVLIQMAVFGMLLIITGRFRKHEV